MLRLNYCLLALALSTSLAVAQIRGVRVIRAKPARLAPADPAAPTPTPAAALPVEDQGASSEPEEPSDELKALLKLKFDRRPSAYLKAWSKPAPKPVEEDTEFDDERAELARLRAEIAATPSEPPSDAGAAPTATAEGAAAGDEGAGTEAGEATPAPHPKQAELDTKQKAYEAAQLKRKLEIFQRDVTLGDWDRVAALIHGLPAKEASSAYDHLLKALPTAPKRQVRQGVPANLHEQNTFSLADVLALAKAAPPEVADDERSDEDVNAARKQRASRLAVIVRRALGAGHATEELLSILRTESAKPDGTGGFTRRSAAQLLVALSRDTDMGEFLPSAEEAREANDREALNLLSRFHLAWYAKEKKVRHLERAWEVTQTALATGQVDEVEKAEALTRAVELAPKIREELGEEWLAESFTERPERGMEIIAAIGAQSSRGFESHPTNPNFRLKGLQLQTTAVDALLTKAPERAADWRLSLNLLAGNWLAEAIYSYGHSEATTMGPIMERDPFGNIFYSSYRSSSRGPVRALEPGDLLKIRPAEQWVAMLDASVQPRFSTVVAELYLKVNEEDNAFPFIEALAETHPEKAHDLAEEFVRVWINNHNPNAAKGRTNPYMYIYGFDQRRDAIPLTRSKQERNLKELAGWVARLKALPIEPVDQKLLVDAFIQSHSTAEVYKLETMQAVFGSLDNLEPKTIAEMAQKMRASLVGVWRRPNTQKQAQTRRQQKDIEREVIGGYETARQVITGALQEHPGEWRLHAALASLAHDQNNYQQQIAKKSDFAANRTGALDSMARAARLYADGLADLPLDEETVEPFELWFYASLGACDLGAIDDRTRLDERQPARIRDALNAIEGEVGERHRTMFANSLFTRMSAANPAVKVRYLRAGFDIIGDHPQAHEARKVFDYYNDLVTEIQLEAVVDGGDVVGYRQPFGLRINLRHTREIERESGGFAKYLTNQNNQMFAYNYGRPLENYRDKFQEEVTLALEEHFEVLSVTFNSEDVHSKATQKYGWRVTPYAYLLLKARGPEVDKVPALRLDLDFLDTSGYAVIPVVSSAVPLDASSEPTAPRPFDELEVTQILDERHASDGKLVLEVKGTAKGLVPDFEEVLEFDPSEFDVTAVEDQGVLLSRFDDDQREIVSERTWMVSMTAKEGLSGHPETFEFAALRDSTASATFQRYVDADLITAERVISLDERYGDPRAWWPWALGLGLLIIAVGGFWFSRRGKREVPEAAGRQMPTELTPFSVLALLRDIEQENGMTPELRQELTEAIAKIEASYFGPDTDAEPDLRGLAETWLSRAV